MDPVMKEDNDEVRTKRSRKNSRSLEEPSDNSDTTATAAARGTRKVKRAQIDSDASKELIPSKLTKRAIHSPEEVTKPASTPVQEKATEQATTQAHEEEPKYKVSEKLFCFYLERLYNAVIKEIRPISKIKVDPDSVEETEDEHGVLTVRSLRSLSENETMAADNFAYFVHYPNWQSSWDEWVRSDCMKPITPETTKEMLRLKKKTKKSSDKGKKKGRRSLARSKKEKFGKKFVSGGETSLENGDKAGAQPDEATEDGEAQSTFEPAVAPTLPDYELEKEAETESNIDTEPETMSGSDCPGSDHSVSDDSFSPENNGSLSTFVSSEVTITQAIPLSPESITLQTPVSPNDTAPKVSPGSPDITSTAPTASPGSPDIASTAPMATSPDVPAPPPSPVSFKNVHPTAPPTSPDITDLTKIPTLTGTAAPESIPISDDNVTPMEGTEATVVANKNTDNDTTAHAVESITANDPIAVDINTDKDTTAPAVENIAANDTIAVDINTDKDITAPVVENITTNDSIVVDINTDKDITVPAVENITANDPIAVDINTDKDATAPAVENIPANDTTAVENITGTGTGSITVDINKDNDITVVENIADNDSIPVDVKIKIQWEGAKDPCAVIATPTVNDVLPQLEEHLKSKMGSEPAISLTADFVDMLRTTFEAVCDTLPKKVNQVAKEAMTKKNTNKFGDVVHCGGIVKLIRIMDDTLLMDESKASVSHHQYFRLFWEDMRTISIACAKYLNVVKSFFEENYGMRFKRINMALVKQQLALRAAKKMLVERSKEKKKD